MAVRRHGLSAAFEAIGNSPQGLFADPGIALPEQWLPRGRWRAGAAALHTFTDDYRQEFFWRRPHEGVVVACAAGFVTAPDFTVYATDPAAWREHQAWRSAMVARLWQAHGAFAVPVVSFGTRAARWVVQGSLWAVRGPAAATDVDGFLGELCRWAEEARPGGLVVFGRQAVRAADVGCRVIGRALRASKCRSPAAQNEGVGGGR